MIPEQYQWLTSLKGLPRTIKLALDEYGVAEVVGKGSNKTIITWRDELNHAGVKITGYSDDDIPWCGLFAAIICYRRMHRTYEVVRDPLWARNWVRYGRSSTVRGQSPMGPCLGDVLVFSRGSGGHVGFYIAEDSQAYHVIGGNQSNKVCITRIAKNRLLAARRPPYDNVPIAVRKYVVDKAGELSTDEA